MENLEIDEKYLESLGDGQLHLLINYYNNIIKELKFKKEQEEAKYRKEWQELIDKYKREYLKPRIKLLFLTVNKKNEIRERARQDIKGIYVDKERLSDIKNEIEIAWQKIDMINKEIDERKKIKCRAVDAKLFVKSEQVITNPLDTVVTTTIPTQERFLRTKKR